MDIAPLAILSPTAVLLLPVALCHHDNRKSLIIKMIRYGLGSQQQSARKKGFVPQRFLERLCGLTKLVRTGSKVTGMCCWQLTYLVTRLRVSRHILPAAYGLKQHEGGNNVSKKFKPQQQQQQA